MRILLTNDDGIYAPGLAAMETALQQLGEVTVVAPATEHSGVSHKITFLTPLTVKKLFVQDHPWGCTVDGSPADCVKIAITEICPEKPDLVVSGINGGLNAGINVVYSGTVAAAMEAGIFGISSVAVSLEMAENEPFEEAAELAVELIRKLLDKKNPEPQVFNINIPVAALKKDSPDVRIVPMDTSQYWELFERRVDPFGRTYFWLSGRPQPIENGSGKLRVPKTDLEAVANGDISVTPLWFDMTRHETLKEMTDWNITMESSDNPPTTSLHPSPALRTKYWK